MASLTKADPPAWAANLGISLKNMAFENQTLQQILQLAATNCQLQGTAAQAQANAAEDIAENQAAQTTQDANSAFAEGAFGLGSSIISLGIEKWYKTPDINEASGKAKYLQGYEDAIAKAQEPQEVVVLEEEKGSDSIEMKDLNITKKQVDEEKQKDITEARTLLTHPVENKPITRTEEIKIGILSKEDPDGFAEFKKMVESKSKTYEKRIQTLNSKKQQREQLIQGFLGAIPKILTGKLFNAQKANEQSASAAMQAAQAIAQYLTQSLNASNQAIMGQKDQMFNLMMSTDQALIGGMAQANQIR